MTRSITALSALPEIGYIRQPQLIGSAPVSPEQAYANREKGKGPRRPRGGSLPIVPWSAATLWRKVKAEQFPAPVKLSEGVTAWRVEDVRAWIESKGAQ
jgi:hypothetical protein